jgi:diaminopimelate epimerase
VIWSKYNASGNDFILSHAFARADRQETARRLCNRVSGIGADGLIVLLPHDRLDFEWDFYNSDGSRANMCGNGARAAALYAFECGLAREKMSFFTGAGAIDAVVEQEGVRAQLTAHRVIGRDIRESGHSWFLVDTGVPHLVTFAELDAFDRLEARDLRRRYDANVNVAYVKNGAIWTRTFERGVEGETLACGTGMAACFVAALEMEMILANAKVYPKSGEELRLSMIGDRVFLQGKVSRVFVAVL